MASVPFDILGGFEKGIDNIIDPQTLGNMYVELDKDSPSGKALIGIPGSYIGLTFTDQSSSSPLRTTFAFNGLGYAVCGNGFYSIDSDLNATRLGTLATTTGHVDYATNLTEILLVDGGAGYLWNGTTFTNPTGFPSNPVSVTYLDGFFLCAQSSSNKFFRNDTVEDGSDWGQANEAKLTTQGEKLKAIVQLKRRILVFGSTVGENWYPVGGSGFTFERDNNVSIEFGCINVSSMAICKEFAGDPAEEAVQEGLVIWLGQTKNGPPRVLMSNGGEVIPISNRALELALQDLTDPSDCAAYIYKINGHVFYDISFTTDNKTFSYDLTTKLWATKFMVDESRYFAQNHMYYNDVHYMGDYKENIIYKVSKEYVTNKRTTKSNGEPIKKVRIWKNYRFKDGQRMMVDLLEIVFRQGAEPIPIESDFLYFNDSNKVYKDDEGNPYYNDNYNEGLIRVYEDPKAYLSISQDGGSTYGYDYRADLGAMGEREFRTMWGPIGTMNSFIGRLIVYDNIGLIIVGANADIKKVNR